MPGTCLLLLSSYCRIPDESAPQNIPGVGVCPCNPAFLDLLQPDTVEGSDCFEGEGLQILGQGFQVCVHVRLVGGLGEASSRKIALEELLP
jgi:hypothetical protein